MKFFNKESLLLVMECQCPCIRTFSMHHNDLFDYYLIYKEQDCTVDLDNIVVKLLNSFQVDRLVIQLYRKCQLNIFLILKFITYKSGYSTRIP